MGPRMQEDILNAELLLGKYIKQMAEKERSLTFRYDNETRNFVMHSTRFYWIIKRNPKIHVLILGGGSCNFQPCFRGGSVIFVPKGGLGREGLYRREGCCFS